MNAETNATFDGTTLSVTGNTTTTGQFYTPTHSIGTVSGSTTVNWDNGNIQSVTLSGNTTFTFTNPQSGASYQIIITQNATGGYTITWPTIYWEADIAPVLTGSSNSVDVATFTYDGSKYLGILSRNFGIP